MGQKKSKTKSVCEPQRAGTEVDLFSSQSFGNAGQTHYPHSLLFFCVFFLALEKEPLSLPAPKQRWRLYTEEVCGVLTRRGRRRWDEG